MGNMHHCLRGVDPSEDHPETNCPISLMGVFYFVVQLLFFCTLNLRSSWWIWEILPHSNALLRVFQSKGYCGTTTGNQWNTTFEWGWIKMIPSWLFRRYYGLMQACTSVWSPTMMTEHRLPHSSQSVVRSDNLFSLVFPLGDVFLNCLFHQQILQIFHSCEVHLTCMTFDDFRMQRLRKRSR